MNENDKLKTWKRKFRNNLFRGQEQHSITIAVGFQVKTLITTLVNVTSDRFNTMWLIKKNYRIGSVDFSLPVNFQIL